MECIQQVACSLASRKHLVTLIAVNILKNFLVEMDEELRLSEAWGLAQGHSALVGVVGGHGLKPWKSGSFCMWHHPRGSSRISSCKGPLCMTKVRFLQANETSVADCSQAPPVWLSPKRSGEVLNLAHCFGNTPGAT